METSNSNMIVDDIADDVKLAMTEVEANPPAQEQVETATETPEQTRARDEQGRFATKTEEQTASTPDSKAADAQQNTDPDKTVSTTPEPSTAGAPPPGWSAEAKAEWAKLPPAIQAAVSKREDEVSNGFRQMSTEVQAWKNIDQMMAPHRQAFANWGAKNDLEAVTHLTAFAAAYDRDPAATIIHLANNARIDLAQLAANPPQPAAQPDPQIIDLRKTVEGLQTEFQSQRTAELQGTIKSFADAKDAQGNLIHPHFEAVKTTMGRLIQAGEAQDMESAYQTAIYMNPDIRGKVMADAQAKADADRRAKEKEAADKARAASRSISGSPVPGTVVTTTGQDSDDLEEIVRSAVRAHA